MVVQLFGNFRVGELGSGDISLLSAQKVLALLCQRTGQDWSRHQLAQLIWPYSDESANRNRLRTALVQVRSALEPVARLSSDKHSVRLEESGLTVDLWEARALLRRSRVAADQAEEELVLRQLFNVIQHPYLANFSDDWVEVERQKWRSRAMDSGLRLGELIADRGDLGESAAAYEAVLELSPFDERAWAALLRVYSARGRHIEICDRLSSARSKLKKSVGGQFSPSLLKLQETVRLGGHYPSELLLPQGDMASRSLARMLQEEPEAALRFLSSGSFRIELFRAPSIAQGLLERALEGSVGSDEARLRCLTYLLMTYSVLQQHEQIRELGPRILAIDQDVARLRAAAMMLSFAYFQIRDWDGAYAIGAKAIDYAEQLGSDIGVALSRATVAAFDWHLGKFDQALQSYQESLKILADSTDHAALSGRGTISLNTGLIHLLRGDYRVAETWLNRALSLAAISDHLALAAFVQLALGTVMIMLDNSEPGADLLTQGLAFAHRQTDPRLIQIGLEYSALSLAHLKYGPQSQAVMERVGAMRNETGHTRSVAEELLVARINELTRFAKPDPDWMSLTSRRKLLVGVLDLLTRR